MKVTAKAKTAVKAEESANGQVIVDDEQVRISLQEKRRQYRGFELEKKYKPGPLSLKQPLTDALKAIARMRAWKAAWALHKKAEQGDVAAFREVADRVEGRVQQTIEVGGQINLGVMLNKARARVGKPPLPDGTTVDAEIVKPESGPSKE